MKQKQSVTETNGRNIMTDSAPGFASIFTFLYLGHRADLYAHAQKC